MNLFDRIRARRQEAKARQQEVREAQEHYKAALAKVIEPNADVKALVSALPDSSALSPAEVARLNAETFGHLAEVALADDLLTEAEESTLLSTATALGIDQARMVSEFGGLLNRLVVAKVNDGRLPTLQESPVILKKGEVAHATMNARLLKEAVLREYRGGYGGFSFRIVKGVRYYTGRTRGHSVVVGSRMEIADSGPLTVTSQRAVFLGSKRSLEFAYGKLLDIHVFSDGIRLAVSNRQTPSTFQLDGSSDLIAAVINAAAQKL